MSNEPADVHASTSAARSVWLTSSRSEMTLGELRRAVAAAAELADGSRVLATTGITDARPIKRIDIQESTTFGRGIVDIVRRDSI